MFERIIEISNPFLVIFSVMSKTSSSAFAYKPEFDKKKNLKALHVQNIKLNCLGCLLCLKHSKLWHMLNIKSARFS